MSISSVMRLSPVINAVTYSILGFYIPSINICSFNAISRWRMKISLQICPQSYMQQRLLQAALAAVTAQLHLKEFGALDDSTFCTDYSTLPSYWVKYCGKLCYLFNTTSDPSRLFSVNCGSGQFLIVFEIWEMKIAQCYNIVFTRYSNVQVCRTPFSVNNRSHAESVILCTQTYYVKYSSTLPKIRFQAVIRLTITLNTFLVVSCWLKPMKSSQNQKLCIYN